jgi:hypothetical protein
LGQKEIMRLFKENMTRRYFRINIAEMCIQQFLLCGMNKIPMAANAAQEEPIMMD